jgi:hypothetical protein
MIMHASERQLMSMGPHACACILSLWFDSIIEFFICYFSLKEIPMACYSEWWIAHLIYSIFL